VPLDRVLERLSGSGLAWALVSVDGLGVLLLRPDHA
jgi:hypothetical protein